jgi:hypothetical protein
MGTDPSGTTDMIGFLCFPHHAAQPDKEQYPQGLKPLRLLRESLYFPLNLRIASLILQHFHELSGPQAVRVEAYCIPTLHICIEHGKCPAYAGPIAINRAPFGLHIKKAAASIRPDAL